MGGQNTFESQLFSIKSIVIILPEMKNYWIHPVIFALFPIFSLFLENLDQVLPRDILPAIAFALFLLLVVYWLIHWYIKEGPKAAIIVSIFMTLFYSHGYALLLLEILSLKYQNWHWVGCLMSDLPGMFILFPIWIIFFVAINLLVLKSKRDLEVTNFLNIVSAVIGIYLVFNLVREYAGEGQAARKYVRDWDRKIQEEIAIQQSINPKDPLPDIYYIILDGYGREDILRERYGYDNSKFISFLKEKGFFIAEESKTNYSQTTYSLASSLNTSYLDQLPTLLGNNFDNLWPLRSMFENNLVFNMLKNERYLTRNIPTGFILTNEINADVNIVPGWGINPFLTQLISSTPLPQIFNLLQLENQFDLHRKRILFALDQIANRPQVDQPVFTFVHILAPHPPFVLDASGGRVGHRGVFIIKDGNQFIGSKQEYRQGYINQVTFISKKIAEVMEKIIENPSRQAIIIIQADHGPGLNLVMENWEQTDLPERMSILNAYYFPDRDYRRLYPGVSPVNTFRIILNQYLGTNYELLEDRSYFVSIYQPYEFHEVTELLH